MFFEPPLSGKGNYSGHYLTCSIGFSGYCDCSYERDQIELENLVEEDYYANRPSLKAANYNENFSKKRYWEKTKKFCVVIRIRPRARSNA